MQIDEHFFSSARKLRQVETGTTRVWSYDKWLNDAEWRKQFLRSLDLSVDITPEVSHFGGGSSFVGRDSKALVQTSDKDRWQKSVWSERVVDMIKENSDLLNDEENAFIAKLD